MGSVRAATRADAGVLRSLMARAFVDDPLLMWVLPDEHRRLDQGEAWLGHFLDTYLHDGLVDCIDETAVAMWLPAGQRTANPPAGAPTLHGLLAGLTGREHATRVLTSFASAGPHRPADPHIYLHIVAVEPARQGQGYGSLVLAPVIAASEEAHVSVHLESANPRNHSFYERLGFERTGVAHLGEGGPSLTTFCREPRGEREIA